MFGGDVRCPLVIRMPGGGGKQLAAQHSQNLEVCTPRIPGLKVVAPATPADAKGLLRAAIRDDDPVLVVENLALYKEHGDVPLDPEWRRADRARQRSPRGHRLTVVGYSRATVRALRVARADGGARTASAPKSSICAGCARWTARRSPSVTKTSRAVIVEEGSLSYGVSAEIAACIQREGFDGLDAPVARVGMAEVPLPYAKALETAALPNEDRIEAAVLETLGRRRMTDVIMPRLSDSMEEGTILKWLKAPGAEVKLRRADRGNRNRQGDDDLRGGRRRLPPAVSPPRATRWPSAPSSRACSRVPTRRRRQRRPRVLRRPPSGATAAPQVATEPAAAAPVAAPEPAPAAEPAAAAPPRWPPSPSRRRRPSPRPNRSPPRVAGASRHRRWRVGWPRELGVDFAALSGSGPEGRVVKADVVAAAPERGEPSRAGRAPATVPGGVKGAVDGQSSRPARSS